MKALIIFFSARFSLGFFLFFFNSEDGGNELKVELVSVEFHTRLTNNLGRKLKNIEVISYLPLNSEPDGVIASEGMRNEEKGQVFTSIILDQIDAGETVESTIRIALGLVDLSNRRLAQDTDLPPYTVQESNMEGLVRAWEDSNSPVDFIRANPGIESLFFLAHKLSTDNQFVRIVSGIKKVSGIKQIPQCWLQILKNNHWQTLSATDDKIIPFKIIKSNKYISEESCGTSLVNVWALDVDDLTITLTL